MAEALILEFDGIGRAEYDAVNAALGIEYGNPSSGYPAGLIFHAGGEKDGGLVVFEVWESKGAQESFMNERLGRALQAGGVSGPPSRAEWIDLVSHVSPV
jgi:hypothetical protein